MILLSRALYHSSSPRSDFLVTQETLLLIIDPWEMLTAHMSRPCVLEPKQRTVLYHTLTEGLTRWNRDLGQRTWRKEQMAQKGNEIKRALGL